MAFAVQGAARRAQRAVIVAPLQPGDPPGRVRRGVLRDVDFEHIDVRQRLGIQPARGEQPREIGRHAKVNRCVVGHVVRGIGLERYGQRRDAERGSFERGAHRARHRDRDADVLAVVDARNDQRRVAVDQLEQGMLDGLGGRGIGAIRAPRLAVRADRGLGQAPVVPGGHAAPHAGLLYIGRHDQQVAQRIERGG